MGQSEPGLAHVAWPSTKVGTPVVVLHSWWGLTRSFTTYADALAGRGFLAGCVDLFDGRVATTEAEARSLRRAKRREPAYRTLQRAIRDLAVLGGGVEPSVIGFSMGGHWAIWLAQHPDPPIGDVVLYYAARAGDFSAATTRVLAHYAETDRFVSAPARQRMERALAARGLEYQAHDYPGTGHWFAEVDSTSFDAPAASAAFDRTTDFLLHRQ